MSISAELHALDHLVKLGRGCVEIGLTEDGNVGIWWTGREGCGITGDSIDDILQTSRYFLNELYVQNRKDTHA